jgi:hypothetical protein
MGLAKGIQAMKESQKAVEKSMSGGGGKYIFIADTESYLFRFMLDGDDIVSGYFHRVPVTRGDKSWFQEVPCEDDECAYCSSADDDINKRTYKFLNWIWVYHIDHVEQDDDGKWEEVEKKDGIFYRETVGAPRLLKQGYFFSKVITALYGKYGTLLDRDYECIRQGEGLKTNYSVFPEDKKAMSKKIKSAIDKLDDLEEIAFGKSTKDDEEADEEKPKASKGKKKWTPPDECDEDCEHYADDSCPDDCPRLEPFEE